MIKKRLFTPGPTMVPAGVMLEMAAPMEHHRTAVFRDIFKEVTDLLGYLFQTRGACLTIAGSGTSAGEAAIVSCCSTGNKALVFRGGKFGERWAEICQAFDIRHLGHDVEWGHAPTGADVEKQLSADPSIDTVIVVHSETSTAAACPLQEIAAVTQRRGVLLIVDGITAVGAIPVKMDDWGVDVIFTGSQKALMLPPGLGFVAANDRAWQRIENGSRHGYYHDLRAYRKSLRGFDTPYTPAVSLVKGVRYVLRDLRRRGLESIWAHTALLARATRAGAAAIGLSTFAADPSDSVTALNVPDGVDEATLRKIMRDRHGMQLAGGQGQLKGRIIRISHMGYMDRCDTLGVIGALELTLQAMGRDVPLGAGVTAAQQVFAQSD